MDTVARLASGLTVAKATLIILNMGVLLIGLGWMLVKFVRTRIHARAERGREQRKNDVQTTLRYH